MKPRTAKKLIIGLWITGIIIMFFSYFNIIFLPIGFFIVLLSILPSIRFYKCPYCGKLLGRNGSDYCQHCGHKIDD